MYNNLKIGDGVASSVVGMLRESSMQLQQLNKRGKVDDLFDIDESGHIKPLPGTPAKQTAEGMLGDEEFVNVDLVTEVATYIESVQNMLVLKVEDLENLHQFCKYLEQHVL